MTTIREEEEELKFLETGKSVYCPYCPFGPYSWVIIQYDGHDGFACDWQDCLEELIFIDGYQHRESFIKYNDEKLTHFESMMCENKIY